jgi:hypothetical protein
VYWFVLCGCFHALPAQVLKRFTISRTERRCVSGPSSQVHQRFRQGADDARQLTKSAKIVQGGRVLGFSGFQMM